MKFKFITFILLILFSQFSFSQKKSKEERQAILEAKKNGTYNEDEFYGKESYEATNGIVYKVGDTIKLGRGSAPNGDFNYLQMGGMYNSLSALQGDTENISSGIGRNYSGLKVILKKIKYWKLKGARKVVFVVGGGNITNYNLMIEDAIATCEIEDCDRRNQSETPIIYQKVDDKYDKIKKLKELLDMGAITKEEYDKEKKKLLEMDE